MVVLLVCLGPLGSGHALTLKAPKSPCLGGFGDSFELKSPAGLFKLVVTLKPGAQSMPRVWEMRLFRGAKPLWTLPFGDTVSQAHTWLAPDGRAVVLLRSDGQLILVTADGQVRKSWGVESLLSKAEQARFPKVLCGDERWGKNARFEGGFFEVEIPPTPVLAANLEGGYRPPVLRLDLAAASLARDGELPPRWDGEIIQAFEAAASPEVRLRLADELLGRSQIKDHLKSRDLNAFWNKILVAPSVRPLVLYRMAVEAVGAYGTDTEVRALLRMPGQIEARDVAVLQVLNRRLPEEAGEYAVRVLEGRHPALAVRQQAVMLLLERRNEARALGVELALSDSSREVRRMGLPMLLNEADPQRHFEQVLGFCKDPEPAVQSMVPRIVLRALTPRATRQKFYELLRRHEAELQVGQCPDVSLLLGALSDKAADRPQALRLFARGLEGLKPLELGVEAVSPTLRQEARLQLALEAEKSGQPSEAERYARQVLSDRHKAARVCAPGPVAHEVPWLSGCPQGQEAQQVARELLGRLKSKRRGG